VIAEVKRKVENLNISELKQKANSLTKQFNDYQISYLGLSMEDM
jgi:hypothetical protein